MKNATEYVKPKVACSFNQNMLTIAIPNSSIPFRESSDSANSTTETASGVTPVNTFNIDLMKYLIKPLKYEIFIHLNTSTNATEASTFHGNVSIELVAKERIKYIVIGACDLGLIALTLTNLEVSIPLTIQTIERQIFSQLSL